MGTDRPDQPGALAPSLPTLHLPEHLESRVSETLRQRGLIGRAPGPRRWLLAAAAILLFAAGFASAGAWRRETGAAHDGRTRFALLLYAGEGPDSLTGDVAAHRRWAGALVAEGRSVSGEKLGATMTTIPDDRPAIGADETLQGFFVISADSAAEAIAIARSLPHARLGGRVVVRAIDPT